MDTSSEKQSTLVRRINRFESARDNNRRLGRFVCPPLAGAKLIQEVMRDGFSVGDLIIPIGIIAFAGYLEGLARRQDQGAAMLIEHLSAQTSQQATNLDTRQQG